MNPAEAIGPRLNPAQEIAELREEINRVKAEREELKAKRNALEAELKGLLATGVSEQKEHDIRQQIIALDNWITSLNNQINNVWGPMLAQQQQALAAREAALQHEGSRLASEGTLSHVESDRHIQTFMEWMGRIDPPSTSSRTEDPPEVRERQFTQQCVVCGFPNGQRDSAYLFTKNGAFLPCHGLHSSSPSV